LPSNLRIDLRCRAVALFCWILPHSDRDRGFGQLVKQMAAAEWSD
jgi:hypothetical protein